MYSASKIEQQLEFEFYQEIKTVLWEQIRAIAADLASHLLQEAGFESQYKVLSMYDFQAERLRRECHADDIVWTRDLAGIEFKSLRYRNDQVMPFVIWKSHEAFLMFSMKVKNIPPGYIRSFDPRVDLPLELRAGVTSKLVPTDKQFYRTLWND